MGQCISRKIEGAVGPVIYRITRIPFYEIKHVKKNCVGARREEVARVRIQKARI
jgi:hypothetical protein